MRNSKKQPWDTEPTPRPLRWRGRRLFPAPYKRSSDLRPYTNLMRQQLIDAHERQAGTENHDCDVDYTDDHHHYLTHFQDNLAYIRDWNQYEVLELLIQKVDLGKTTIPWLRQFREDLDLKV